MIAETVTTRSKVKRDPIVLDGARRRLEDQLARQWSGLPIYVLNRYFRKVAHGLDSDELHSVANYALAKAIRFYKPDYYTEKTQKNVQFNTYAVYIITCELRRHLGKSYDRGRHVLFSECRVYDKNWNINTVIDDTSEESVTAKAELDEEKQQIQQILEQLKPIHRDLILDYIGGFPDENGNERPRHRLTHLGIKYQVSVNTVKKTIASVLNKLGITEIPKSTFSSCIAKDVKPCKKLSVDDIPNEQLCMFEVEP